VIPVKRRAPRNFPIVREKFARLLKAVFEFVVDVFMDPSLNNGCMEKEFCNYH
jgi:ribosomal protein L31E